MRVKKALFVRVLYVGKWKLAELISYTYVCTKGWVNAKAILKNLPLSADTLFFALDLALWY